MRMIVVNIYLLSLITVLILLALTSSEPALAVIGYIFAATLGLAFLLSFMKGGRNGDSR